MATSKGKSIMKSKSESVKNETKVDNKAHAKCGLMPMCPCKAIKGGLIVLGVLLSHWHQAFLLLPLLLGIGMILKSYTGWCGFDNALKSAGCCCCCKLGMCTMDKKQDKKH